MEELGWTGASPLQHREYHSGQYINYGHIGRHRLLGVKSGSWLSWSIRRPMAEMESNDGVRLYPVCNHRRTHFPIMPCRRMM